MSIVLSSFCSAWCNGVMQLVSQYSTACTSTWHGVWVWQNLLLLKPCGNDVGDVLVDELEEAVDKPGKTIRT